MKYINAEQVLPKELIKELQKYTQGQYVYVPAKEGERKQWGTHTGIRKEIQERNRQIRERYKEGESKDSLSKSYCLSLASINKIIYAA
ncbi:MAG: CD3324 family protein [Cellulosilyticaceae bacterium]